MDPSIPTIQSIKDTIKVQLLYLTGLLPFCKLNFDTFCVPFLTRDYLKILIDYSNSSNSVYEKLKY